MRGYLLLRRKELLFCTLVQFVVNNGMTCLEWFFKKNMMVFFPRPTDPNLSLKIRATIFQIGMALVTSLLCL